MKHISEAELNEVEKDVYAAIFNPKLEDQDFLIALIDMARVSLKPEISEKEDDATRCVDDSGYCSGCRANMAKYAEHLKEKEDTMTYQLTKAQFEEILDGTTYAFAQAGATSNPDLRARARKTLLMLYEIRTLAEHEDSKGTE